jgi:hypothetical protein
VVHMDSLALNQMKLITPQNIGTAKPATAHCVTRFFTCNSYSFRIAPGMDLTCRVSSDHSLLEKGPDRVG